MSSHNSFCSCIFWGCGGGGEEEKITQIWATQFAYNATCLLTTQIKHLTVALTVRQVLCVFSMQFVPSPNWALDGLGSCIVHSKCQIQSLASPVKRICPELGKIPLRPLRTVARLQGSMDQKTQTQMHGEERESHLRARMVNLGTPDDHELQFPTALVVGHAGWG